MAITQVITQLGMGTFIHKIDIKRSSLIVFGAFLIIIQACGVGMLEYAPNSTVFMLWAFCI
jgi:MFS family permease